MKLQAQLAHPEHVRGGLARHTPTSTKEPAMSSALLTLPRELRDEIYRYVLIEPHSIYIVSDVTYPRRELHAVCSSVKKTKGKTLPRLSRTGSPEGLCAGRDFTKNTWAHWAAECGNGAKLFDLIRQNGAWPETSLLYTNHQLSAEAQQVFYKENTFTISPNVINCPSMGLKWVLGPKFYNEVRKIKFGVQDWPFIASEATRGFLRSLDRLITEREHPFKAVEVPIAVNMLDVPENRSAHVYGWRCKTMEGVEGHSEGRTGMRWPALRHLVTLLMEGAFRELSLVYPARETPANQFFPGLGHPTQTIEKKGEDADSINAENQTVIKLLRIPRVAEADQHLEHELWGACAKARSRWDDLDLALLKFEGRDDVKERRRHDFMIKTVERDQGDGVVRLTLRLRRSV